MAPTVKENGLIKITLFQSIELRLMAIIFGAWYIVQTFFNKLWKQPNLVETSRNPPLCLTDNSIGQHSTTKLKDVKFHYVESGDKNSPLVLLLHGFPDCWISWRHQFPELSKYFRVVAVDLKGFGDSDKPLSSTQYEVEQLAQEIHDFILALGYQRAILIGHDLGGLLGWFVVHFHPEVISKFVAVSSCHPNYYWDSLTNDVPINKRWIQFCQLPGLPEEKALNNDSNLINDVFNHLKGSDSGESILSAYKYVFSRKEDWTGAINYFRILPYYRLKTDEPYHVPILLIVGNQDEHVRLENVIKSSEYLDKFRVKIIENAGHYPHQQNHADFNRIILNYLTGSPPSSPDKTKVTPKYLVTRVFGAVTSTVKYGATGVIDVIANRRAAGAIAPSVLANAHIN